MSFACTIRRKVRNTMYGEIKISIQKDTKDGTTNIIIKYTAKNGTNEIQLSEKNS
jgi:hypothetical protein